MNNCTVEQGIKQFDFKMIDDLKQDHNPFILLTGQRHSGKGILMRELIIHLDKKFKYERAFAFSLTDHLYDDWEGGLPFLDNKDIFDTLDPLKQIIDIRKSSITTGKISGEHPESRKDLRESDNKAPKKKKKIGNLLLIFNDIYGLNETINGKTRLVKNSNSIETLATLARHYKITCIVSVQRAKSMVSKLMRSNSDISFIWSPKSSEELDLIRGEYLGLCKSKQLREMVFNNIFSIPHACMVVLNYKTGVTQIEEYVFSYVAPYPAKKYKMLYTKKKKKILRAKKKLKDRNAPQEFNY